ncbi:putative ABC exporter domain-containing protein [Thermoanaerobacter sp. A7A]|uniref:putative ABC exporter domain-containing protein n=1 Tax=Thermoanaerobacter sp. A7A TaxID=1350366 RepID=UPI000412D2D5|nr:putative ABC exporter domain-containing protein [Thermoanaerobacter sp. A7A]
MSEINALFIFELMKIKNSIKDIIRNPNRIFVYLFMFLGYFLMLISIILGNMDNKAKLSQVSELKLSFLEAGLVIIILFEIILSIYSSLKQPGIIVEDGDMTFLFSSPIDERKIFLWYMVKGIFKYFALSILFVVYLPFLSNMMSVTEYSSNLVYGYLGIFTNIFALVPLNFLIYSISMKFNAKKLIQYILSGILILIAGFGFYFIYKAGSIFGIIDYLSSNAWDYVPILGPSKLLILSYFTGEGAYNLELVFMQLLTIISIILIALYFATDYYEEVITYSERVREIRNKVKKEGFYSSAEESAKKIKKKKDVVINLQPKGPWAYIWLKMVENKRSLGSIYFNYYNLFLLLASIAFGYFLPKDDPTIIFAMSFLYVYIAWLFSFASTVSTELNKMYIYIIPGEGIEKLIAVNLIPLLKAFIAAILIIVPASIFMKPGILNTITAIVFIISFSTLDSFSAAFMQLLLPSKQDLKVAMPLFKIFGFLFILLPVVAVAVPLGIITKNMVIGVLTAALMMFLESGVFLLFANFIFERLELK